ncbi:metal-sensing transcriptional repressor [Shimazuella kribbensis]|uniref:metal-sensing transcriptional repressor n=1 Tax=Shimazuella kribbensis TaxID=139808 RepID=UPI0003F580B6|nr:metal-sensing transcriptional repressor [Shimazuella kribbensis]
MKELQTPDHSEEICCSSTRESQHSKNVKHNLTSRLNRIEGQVRGIKKLIDKKTYCDDVINQISAVQSALRSASNVLIEGHLRSCIVGYEKEDDEIMDKVLPTMKRLMKL